MHDELGKLSYALITSVLRMPVFKLIKEFGEAEAFSRDELIAYQWQKLQDLVHYAVTYSPYYKTLFAQIGAEPGDIKDEADFKKIPILTKEVVQDKWDQILITRPPKPLYAAKTSGSTGLPLKIYKDAEGRASTYAAMYRGHMWYGCPVGSREARLWSVPYGRIDACKTGIKDFVLNRRRQKRPQINEIVFENFYNQLKRFKPGYLMGYPSLISQFAQNIADTRGDARSLNLSFVKCTGEVTYDHQRELIEAVFGCPCISEYGAAETGVIAFECPHRRNHLMSHSVYVESLENDFENAQDLQSLLVTNLYNTSFPIIRYSIGDLGKLEGSACECGRSLPLVSGISGRIHDTIIGINGEVFHSSALSNPLKEFVSKGMPIEQIRFVQEREGTLSVQIVDSGVLSRELTDHIGGVVRDCFNDKVSVCIQKVDFLPRVAGKFGYFESRLKNHG